MTNRPIDYEHPFARLVPNDIVTPTTEVVKEESIADWLQCKGMPKLSEEDYQTNLDSLTPSATLGIDTGEEQSYSIVVKFDANTGTVVDCDIKEKEDDIPLPPLKHVGTMTVHCTKPEKLEFVPDFDEEELSEIFDTADDLIESLKEPEEEPQTGWRFLGYKNSSMNCRGEFTIGEIYKCVGVGKKSGNLLFIDDRSLPMSESHKCFEQVK